MVDIIGLMGDLRWPEETYEDLKGPLERLLGSKGTCGLWTTYWDL